jgi:hypothetical protein
MAQETLGVSKFFRDLFFARAQITAITGATNAERKVYAYRAPEGKVLPFITFALQSGTDIDAIGKGKTRLMTTPLYMVKGVSQADTPAVAQQLASEIDEALTPVSNVVVPVAGGFTFLVQGCYRERQIEYPEYTNDRNFFHSGGLYRLIVSQV